MGDVRQNGGPGCPRLVVGLGNPGPEYDTTRHNLGFRVVRQLASRWHVELDRLECNALLADESTAVLAMPQTFMNRSGYAVRCLVERRSIDPGSVLIVYDDVNLELGRLRLRGAGGPGGHHGMESVIQNLRTEQIARLRLGIGVPASEAPADLVEFVLSPFTPAELEEVEKLITTAADACESWLRLGLEVTMNRFNR